MFHALCHHKIKFSRANRRLAILLRSYELHALELPSLIQEKLLLISGSNSSTDIISSAHPICFAFIIAMLLDVSGARYRLSYLLNVSKTSNIGDQRTSHFSILPFSGRSDYFSGLPLLCSACRFTSEREVATSIS